MLKHMRSVSKKPGYAVIGPELSWIQQWFAFLTKGKFIPA